MPEQRAALNKCVQEVKTTKPLSSDQTQEEYIDGVGPLIVSCMGKKGYHRDLASPQCLENVYTNPYCYIPNNGWQKFGYVFGPRS
jgi:hypothetical protein